MDTASIFFLVLILLAVILLCMMLVKTMETIYFKREIHAFMASLNPAHYMLNMASGNVYVFDLDTKSIFWKFCRHQGIFGTIPLSHVDSIDMVVNGNTVQSARKQGIVDTSSAYASKRHFNLHKKEHICIRLYRHDLHVAYEDICFEDIPFNLYRIKWFKKRGGFIPCGESAGKNAAIWYSALLNTLTAMEEQNNADAHGTKERIVCPHCTALVRANAVFCPCCQKELPPNIPGEWVKN